MPLLTELDYLVAGFYKDVIPTAFRVSYKDVLIRLSAIGATYL
jgi:hypothetical protein